MLLFTIKARLSTLSIALLIIGSSQLALAKGVDVEAETLTMNRELRKDVVRTVARLSRSHYAPKELNDQRSNNILDTYLESLDPNKIYFTQQDIDDLQPVRSKIDDYFRSNDAEIGFQIYKLFRQRVEQRTALVESLLDQKINFSVDEEIDLDRENYQWADSGSQMKEIWRKRIKNDVLRQKLAETPEEEIRENLSRRYQRQRDVIFQLKPDEVFEIFMNAYARELGPHTQYMSHITTENFNISMSLSLEGIGAALLSEEEHTVINRIIPGGPAERSGLIKADDKIVAVGQDGEEMINVIGWRLTDVVQMIRGDKGTNVRLALRKADAAPGSPAETIELVRDVIQLEDQAAKLSHVEVPEGHEKKKFAVISIPSFYSNANQVHDGVKYKATAHDVTQLIEEIDPQTTAGLVIDLRGNGGGYLDEAVRLTGLFIPEGPVVQSVLSNKKRDVRRDRDRKVAYDGPMVVLIDRFSASASEIFAAALQDYGRALIIGERSFGKGTVQTLAPLRSKNEKNHQSQVKFTIAQFFRVNGGSTQHKGVLPDIRLNSTIEDEDFGERALDNALPWSKTQAVIYKANQFSTAMVKQLADRHFDRADHSPAFSLLRQTSERIHKNKNTKQLSLNLETRTALRDQIEQQSLDQLNSYRASLGLEAVTKKSKSDNPLPDEDEHWNIVYHREAAQILLDQIHWSDSMITSVEHANP